MEKKINQLKSLLNEMDSVVVAYSGGTDSTLLLKIVHDIMGEKAIALTAVSASMPQLELEKARQVASQIGARHVFLETRETDDPRYLENTPNRCYFCRLITYQEIDDYAKKNGFRFVLDGSNIDDLIDHRPGRLAAQEFGVRSPLQEAGFSKLEIRSLAHQLGLPNWNQPAAACLSSRIPYGNPITIEILSRVEAAENALKSLGFSQLRVRHHDKIARIEIHPDEFQAILHHRDVIITALKNTGYHFVTLDLTGFRSGSLNEVLSTHGSN